MKKLSSLFCLLLLTYAVFATEPPADTSEIKLDDNQVEAFLAEYQETIDSINSSFSYQTGNLNIGDGLVSLELTSDFRFLDPGQTQTVIEDLWGNPDGEGTLGMLIPTAHGPADDEGWGIIITYSEEGFVEDEDADDIDYAELLESMKEEVAAENEQREELGYEKIELVGWAQPPFYDKAAKKLHWAKEIKFGDSEENTLNYNIRVLGRRGYLQLNIVAEMGEFEAIKPLIPEILNAVEFNEGHRYSDFDPDLDEVAAVGIGGLIAGKVLAKVGFFAPLAKFWKIIIIGIGAGLAGIRRSFLGKN